MKMRFAYHGAAAYSAPRSTLAARLGAMLGDAMAMPRLWAGRRHERRDLLRLDDHMLRDIGIDRSRAGEMAARPFRRA
ncbi:MAG TPA: DUF1127 domain-containing protein [Dongiaceae bacterium]|nr:DUF1127 domain-containing protein [Dongiaceae bacterium]